MKIKHIIGFLFVVIFVGAAGGIFAYFIAAHDLPKIVTVQDYKPLVVSEVYARDGKTKIAEYYREKRTIIPYTEIPKHVVNAFVSAEDHQFFEHGGINYMAILRAAIANIKAGHAVQGGSTITQQVTKSLLLTPEKTLTRKLKEAILAFRLEKNLKKEEILFLYLNQIYLGHSGYGVEAAAQNYFRKHIHEVTIAEAALLAGLPQAPSRYSPVLNPSRAKERQLYVLGRMLEDGKISKADHEKAVKEPVKVYFREDFAEQAPHFAEVIRQILVEKLGEKAVLDEGIRVYTSLDPKFQKTAQEAVEKNLWDLSKRQGFKGAKSNLKTPEEIAQFLTKSRDEYYRDANPFRIITGTEKDTQLLPPLDLTKKPGAGNLPAYLKVGQRAEGVVTKIDSKFGLVTVRIAEAVGLIDLDDLSWARKPDPTKYYKEDVVTDPAKVLQVGDVVDVKIKAEKFFSDRLKTKLGLDKKKKGPLPTNLPVFADFLALTLEQPPTTQGALLSLDLTTNELVAMVGGHNLVNPAYNRALQAARQTGSAFKALIYAAALEKGFTPASLIQDAPVVFEEEQEGQEKTKGKDTQPEMKTWKPGNFSEKFSGDVLFRTALIKSLNVPTVKILEKIGLDWATKYARRLGIFRPLNKDFSMALGSSGITLYEMTKAFSVFAKGGRILHPLIIKKVTTAQGQVLIENVTLDEKYQKELAALDEEFAEGSPTPTPLPNPEATPAFSADSVFHFADKDRLIPATSAFITTHLLKGVVNEGTAARARGMPRPIAGKTGTTNGYYDALFIGYSPYISTGVWVGNDNESSIGRLETGASAALPIWMDYMAVALEDTPKDDFPVPPGIVFANIDAQTGKIATSKSAKVVREAFKEGTEPQETSGESSPNETKEFFKEDLSE